MEETQDEKQADDSSVFVHGQSRRVVVPGEEILEISRLKEGENDASGKNEKIALGPGLRQEGSSVFAISAGLLRSRVADQLTIYWVDTHSKRYVATKGDNVVGVVLSKSGDIFRVDIGASQPASLSYLAFEGATKRNRPNINVGDIVYAKLITASRDTEPEIVCINSNQKSAGMGAVEGGGMLFTVPLNLSRKLINKDYPLLPVLGKNFSYEICVGMNGRVWVKGRSIFSTICICNAIFASEHMSGDEIRRMCSKLDNALKDIK